MRAFLALILLGAVPVLASAEDESSTTVGGRVYTDQYVFTSAPNSGNLEQSSLSAWLDVDSRLGRGFGLRVIGQGDAFYRSIPEPSRPSARASIREGYVSWLGTGIELKVGQQIIPWGKSDGVNPTDYFTAKNLTLLNPDEEVRRSGGFALNLTVTPDEGNSPVTFQVVAQANSPRTKLLIPVQSIPAGVRFTQSIDSPLPFEGNYEIGGKISYLKSDFDLSISAFRGYSRFPQYVLTPGITPSVSPIYPAQTAVGADASFTAGDQILRFETALLMPDNGKNTDPLAGFVEPWHWDSVVGIERPIGDDFRVQVQLLYRWHLFFPTANPASGNPVLDQLTSGIARANALILNYQYRGNPGATFRFAYSSEHSDFSGDVFLIGYFANGQDYLIRPQIGYTPVTNLKILAGADIYGGNESRPLGALRARSHVFFETRYLF